MPYKIKKTFSLFQARDYPYFRKTWNRVIIILLTSSLLPLLLIGGSMYFYSTSSLKEQTMQNLELEVKSQTEIQEHVYAQFKKARNIGIIVFTLGGLLLVFSVLLTTDYLVYRLEEKRKAIRLLDQQLLNMSRLASSMQLSYSYFREVKDVLLNLDIVSQWAIDLLKRDKTQEAVDSLTQIKAQSKRINDSIEKFLKFIRPPGTAWLIQEIQVNEVLRELLEFLAQGFRIQNIQVIQDLDENLPSIQSNISRLRQVLQNLFLTVLSDMPKGGEIVVRTEDQENSVNITLTYPNETLTLSAVKEIVDPAWTSQAYGPGIWLSVCADQIEKLHGSLKFESPEDRKLSFILVFPLTYYPQMSESQMSEIRDQKSERSKS